MDHAEDLTQDEVDVLDGVQVYQIDFVDGQMSIEWLKRQKVSGIGSLISGLFTDNGHHLLVAVYQLIKITIPKLEHKPHAKIPPICRWCNVMQEIIDKC